MSSIDEELEFLTRTLRLPRSELVAVYRCGSVVYGTNTPTSDVDFVVVVRGEATGRDLAKAPGRDYVVFSREAFQASLRTQKLFAIEAHHAPKVHRLLEARTAFTYKLDAPVLVEASLERARSDYEKALRRWDEDPASARKRLFHALRTLRFTEQLLREKSLVDFTCANGDWQQLRALETRAEADAQCSPTYTALVEAVRAFTRR